MAFNIEVVNIYKYSGEIDSVIMRGRSPIANPYPMRDRSDMERTRVTIAFKKHLWADMQAHGAMYRELERLIEFGKKTGHLVLGCCCKPKPCHGDVVKSAIEWMNK